MADFRFQLGATVFQYAIRNLKSDRHYVVAPRRYDPLKRASEREEVFVFLRVLRLFAVR
jgi:hypothetical protein